MNDVSDKPWAWVVPLLYSAQHTMESFNAIPTTAIFYHAPGSDPLGLSTREKPEITQVDGVNLSSPGATQQSIELLQKLAFEDGPDSIMMIGEGWDFSDQPELMEKIRAGEEVQPETARPCVFCTVETPSMYYMSQAEVVTDKHGFKTFIPRALMLFEEVETDRLNGRFARILPANKLSP